MKISTTKDNTVSFVQMTPSMAQALIDIASDLAEGNAVLLYGPEYDEPVCIPTAEVKADLAKVAVADDRFPGAVSTTEHGRLFKALPFPLGADDDDNGHQFVWDMVLDETTKETV